MHQVLRLDVKLFEFIDGQINAAAQCVFADITQDVGQLESQAQGVCILRGRWVGLAKNFGGHFAHHTRHQVAIALQARVVQIACLRQVHLATFNHRHQMMRFNAIGFHVRHQGMHDRMRWVALEGLNHFFLPPCQGALGYARVRDFIHHIVYFSAKRIESCDGSSTFGGQEKKGVIKTAARAGGFLLDVLLGCHGARFSHCLAYIQRLRHNIKGRSQGRSRGRVCRARGPSCLTFSKMRMPPCTTKRSSQPARPGTLWTKGAPEIIS